MMISKQGETLASRHRDGERGAIIIHVALAVLGLLAFSSFTIDNGMRMVARGQAQTAADAGAMAAALYLAWDDAADFAGAKAAGVVAAQQNIVWGEAPDVQLGDVTFPTCPPGAPGLVDTCVQVNVFRNQARANPLPTVFARLAGPIDQGVQAPATAQVLYGTGPGPGNCVKPFAIPDRWGNTETTRRSRRRGSTTFHRIGPLTRPTRWCRLSIRGIPTTSTTSGTSTARTGASTSTILWLIRQRRVTRSIGTLGCSPHHPGITSRRTPSSRFPENDNGTILTLKHGNGTQISSSWYYPIVLPNTCGTGAACYRANIAGCATGEGLSVGTELMNEPGNMVGPTGQGIDALYLQDPNSFWMNDGPGGTYPRGIISTTSGGMGMASPRLAIVPTFNPETFMAGHMNGRIGGGGGPSNPEIVITGFVGIFFLPMVVNDAPGHLSPLNFTPTPDNLSDDPTSFLRTVILVR